jgi:prephenate dehydrogenase
MLRKPYFSSSLVIGGSGAVGNLFVQTLMMTFPEASVSVLDRVSPTQQVLNVRYEYSLDRYRSELDQFDLVILALPEAAALTVLQEIRPWLSAATLVVDTLSVKSNLYQQVHALEIEGEYLSINPMFAPNLGFAQHTVLAVPFQSGDRTGDFLALLEEWGAIVQLLSADQHDRATAQLQSLTHAAILAFGLTLVKSGYDIDQLLAIAPPPHKMLLCLIARILSGSPDVYWDIQLSNPHAADMRMSLLESIRTIDTLIAQGSNSDFVDLFTSLQGLLADQNDSLTEQCKVIFKSLS